MSFQFIRKNPIDFLIAIFLVGSISCFNNWLAGFFQISLTDLGIFTIFLLSSYIVINLNTLIRLLQEQIVWVFIVLFLAYPIFTLVYSPMGFSLRETAIYLLNIEHWFSIAIIMYKCPIRLIGWMGGLGLLVASFGAFASVLHPSMFDCQFDANLMQSLRKTSLEMGTKVILGRAFGFTLEPNVLGSNIIMFTLIYTCFYATRYAFTKLLMLAISFSAIVLTGSRGAMLSFLIFSIILFAYYFKNGIPLKGNVRSTNVLANVVAIGILSIFSFGIVKMGVLSSTTETLAMTTSYYENPLQRIVRFLSGNTSDEGGVNSRLALMKNYAGEIAQHPLGSGLFAMEYHFFINPERIGGAHNEFLRIGYELGILYLLIILIYFFKIFFGENRYRLINSPPFMLLAFATLFWGCMFSHTVSTEKHFCFVLATVMIMKILLNKNDVTVD